MLSFIEIGLAIWHSNADRYTHTHTHTHTHTQIDIKIDRQKTWYFPTRTITIHSVKEMTECKNRQKCRA